MSRQQLPSPIKKVRHIDKRTGKTVLRYQLRVDAGVNGETGGTPASSARLPHRGSRPSPTEPSNIVADESGADDGNRTRVFSLGS
jgi:hypothetical protein